MESANLSLVAFLAILCVSMLVQVEAQSRVDEVQSLISFREALGVNNSDGYWFTWNKNDENACLWGGVTCTANFTVAALDLSGWGIRFLYSVAALSKLPDLRQLDLSSNYLFGNIPDDIGSLIQVTRLDLSRSLFLDQIPPTISRCRSLRYLSLEQNSLQGPIPDLSEMVHLQFLLLAANNLTGSFPNELGEMSSLISIDLSGNQLNGSIPSLGNSTRLVSLKLDNNFFVGFEEPLYLNAPNLQEWDVSGNQLEGTIPLDMTNLPHLLVLNMSRNRLSGKIPSGLSYRLSYQAFPVYILEFSQNRLSGSIPVDLLQPPHGAIAYINVSYNCLNESLPTPSTDTNVLVSLDLSHNQLKGPIPSTLFAIEVLLLEHNLLSGDIVDALVEKLQRGRVLLGNNLLTGDLSRMTSKWNNSYALSVMDLSNNNLSWTTTESIPDPLTAALENFPIGLAEFRVGGNNFLGTSLPRGPLFLAQGGLHYVQVLDFSNNQLQGTISGDVFNTTSLPSLAFLNLSNNQASGPVPENLITLFEERTVVDSRTGQLLDMVLDLSNNKLSGALPAIPLNSTLTNPSVFTGNDGLCGYPLSQCPQHRPQLQLWLLLAIIGGTVLIATGSCVVAAWKWRVYHKLHQQDEDLIQTLLQRDSATLMSLRELRRATNNFSESVCIGEGAFGTVYKGELDNGIKVAIKKSKREGSEEDKQKFLNEVRILSQVNHRHLVKLLGCCMENKVSLLIFEFVSNGTLQEHLQGKIGDVGLSWKQRLNIAVQTADALNYLHTGTNFPIYHRDVKSANILLNDDLSTKVADFGISMLVPMQATHISTACMGTIGYMDPEYYTYHRLTDRSDVYSFGVVLLELISAKPAVFEIDGEMTNLVMFAIPYIESGDMQALIDPKLLETYNATSGHEKESILRVGRLVVTCLAMPSKERPSMNEVWKELQNLCLELNGTSRNEALGSINRNNNESPCCDHTVLDIVHVPKIFSNQSYSSDIQNDSRNLELSCITTI